MSLISLTPGSIVYLGKDRYEVTATYDLKSILAKKIDTGEQRLLPVASLRSSPEESQPADSGIDTILHIDEEHWKIALERYEVIKPLLKVGRTKDEVIARAKEFDVSPVTVYRWIADFETTGTVSALVPKYDQRGGSGKTRLDKTVEDIINEVIQKVFLNKQKKKPGKVYEEIKRLLTQKKLDVPHLNTIINRINKLSEKQKADARQGKKWSRDHYGEATGHYPEGKYPLDVVQIDHTMLNVLVVDEKHRETTYRVWLTVAIDVFSRVIVGFYISPDRPSYFSVSQCLTNAFLPKDKFLRYLKVEGAWDVWGKEHEVFVDNAREFRGTNLKRVCQNYGTILQFRPVKHPEYGAHIERLCGTLNEEIHTLPGTTFESIEDRGDYDSEKEAVMTILELEQWFTDFVVNTYHKRPHSGINDMAPIAKYQMGICGDDTMPGTGLPDAFEDEEALRISFYPQLMKAVRRDGIVIEGIHYYHDVLRKWINTSEGRKKRRFQVNYNPRDMSIIYFLEPDLNKFFPIPYRNMAHRPLSWWEIRAERKYLRKKGMRTIDEDSIFRSYERRMHMVAEATDKTKKARKESRKRADKKSFHDQKLQQEKESIKQASNGTDKSKASEAEQAKKSNLSELFNNVKPYEGIKVVRQTEEGSGSDK